MNIVAEKGDGVTTLKMEGWVDTITSPILQEAILNVFMKAGSLVLDFTQVECIGNVGLHALPIGEKMAKGRGGSVKLTHVITSMTSVFEVAEFSGILYIE